MAPFFSRADVERAVSPEEAYFAVREAFIAYARGEWAMQPKLYVTNYPAGDFRAMPALGGGHALLKWVTSFPGNPALGLPTVTGLVLLNDAETGVVAAVLDAGAVTALRTGAAAVLAAATLGRGGSIAVVGCGVNGKAAARTFAALGLAVSVWDVDTERAAAAADEVGAAVAPSREEALAADVVVTVTPGKEILYPAGSLRDGPARLADGRRRARQGRDRSRGDRPLAPVLRRLGAGLSTGASSQPQSKPASSRGKT